MTNNVLAIAGSSARWLREQAGFTERMFAAIAQLDHQTTLDKGIAVVGPLRLARHARSPLVAVWNADYVPAAGEFYWGLIALDSPFSVVRTPECGPQVLERMLEVIHTRMSGLLLTRDMEPRENGGVPGVIAGRGSDARRYRIHYIEKEVKGERGPIRAMVLDGPAEDGPKFQRSVRLFAEHIDVMANQAFEVWERSPSRPILDRSVTPELEPLFPSLSPVRPAPSLAPERDLQKIDDDARLEGLTYDEWIAPSSPLSDAQRRILREATVETAPVRIVGAAGSGKTLLMQLLALSTADGARDSRSNCRILYLCHNRAMVDRVLSSFDGLREGSARRFSIDSVESDNFVIHVTTLLELALAMLRGTYGGEIPIYDVDAQQTKDFQKLITRDAMQLVLEAVDLPPESPLFVSAQEDPALMEPLADAIAHEISSVLKPFDMIADQQKYVMAERALSRFHGVLQTGDREILFQVYEHYRRLLSDEWSIMDVDDVAISMAAMMSTPIWERRRRNVGYDYVFVDESQLFNENEKRLMPLLGTGSRAHVPMVLALDMAQDTRAIGGGGLGALGFGAVRSESLGTVYRSTKQILGLAFWLIQRTNDLFGAEFPDFTRSTDALMDGPKPEIRSVPDLEGSLCDVVEPILKRRRTVAVVVHYDGLLKQVEATLRSRFQRRFAMIESRGKVLSPDVKLVAGRPEEIGGQEFDCVVCVGLERGVSPPKINNAMFQMAMTQQVLREMYVAVTRARTEVLLLMRSRATPNEILEAAVADGLVVRPQQ